MRPGRSIAAGATLAVTLTGLVAPVSQASPSAAAVPARTEVQRGAPVPDRAFTIAQPDGTRVQVVPRGDGARHWYATPAGDAVVQGPDHAWRYAAGLDAQGRLTSSTVQVGHGQAPTRARGLKPSSDNGGVRSGTAATTGTSGAQAAAAPMAPVVGPIAHGTQRELVILAAFTDQGSVGSSAAQWAARYFGASQSVKDFYEKASGGAFSLAPASESSGAANDGVVGWVTLPMAHPNFGGNDSPLEQTLTIEAVKAADPYVDYASFDTNGDGTLSPNELHITVIAAGYETAYSGPSMTCGKNIWAHMWGLAPGTLPTLDGKQVGSTYTQFGEWHCATATGESPGQMATIGVMAHEIGHDLGWPDLYDTVNFTGGLGNWSLMASGTWNASSATARAGSSPALPDAWARAYQGWVSPTRLMGGWQPVSLAAGAAPLQLLDNAGGPNWLFQHSSGSGRYFLAENRQRTGYDVGLPGCGILLYDVDETAPFTNTANSGYHRLVSVVQANGSGSLIWTADRGTANDPFPGATGARAVGDQLAKSSPDYLSSGAALRSISDCAPTMTAEAKSVPVNDAFAGATAVPLTFGPNSVDSVVTDELTREAGEPEYAAGAGRKSAWYAVTPSLPGTVLIEQAGPYDTFSVYDGSMLATLTSVPTFPAVGSLGLGATAFLASAGHTYRVALSTPAAATGRPAVLMTLKVRNDLPAYPLPLVGTSGSVTPDFLNATPESFGGAATVFYSYTPTADGRLVFAGSTAAPMAPDVTVTDAGAPVAQTSSLLPGMPYAVPVRTGHTYLIGLGMYYGPRTATESWRFEAANDAFAQAWDLQRGAGDTLADTTDATVEAGEPSPAAVAGAHSTWFRWTAPVSGTLDIDTAGSTFDTTLGVYTGSTLGTLTEVASNDDASGVTTSQVSAVPVVAGTTYRIQVDGKAGATGQVHLSWALTGANDAFAGAQLLAGSPVTVHGSLAGSTLESGEPADGTLWSPGSVWYRWVAPADGVLDVSTVGTAASTNLGIYTGSTVAALTRVASAGTTDSWTQTALRGVSVRRGLSYSFRVAGVSPWGPPGLVLSLAFRPANDAFAAATTLGTPALGVATAYGSTLGATREVGEPVHAAVVGGGSVWYRWTAPGDGRLTLSTYGSSFDTLLGLYRGTSVAALTKVAANDNVTATAMTSAVSNVVVTKGVTYAVAVAGKGASKGAAKLTLTYRPSNDNFGGLVVAGRSVVQTRTNVGATKQTGEPRHAGNAGGGSLWYSWVAPKTGTLTLTTQGSSVDTLLALYSGSTVTALTPVRYNDNAGTGLTYSRVVLPVVAGRVYRIAVDGKNNARGTIRLAWSLP